MTKRERKYHNRPKITKVMVNKKDIMALFAKYLMEGKGMRPIMHWYADNLKDQTNQSQTKL